MLRGGLEQEACSWIAGWVGQLGALAPWAVTVVAASGPLGHLASICELDIKLFIYLFGIFRQAGSVQLLKAGLNVGLYK